MKRKNTGFRKIEGPYAGACFQGGAKGTIYADFRRRGAEYVLSIPKIMDNRENVKLQSRRLAPILGSVPLRRHIIPGGRGMRKRTRAPNRGQFSSISGAEVLSAPPLSLR